MRYIRTRDGIFEFIVDWYISIQNNKTFINTKYDGIVYEEEVLKQADTIEELIMPGDLVRYDGLYMSWIEKDRGDEVRGIDMHLIPRKSVDMLWIPIGNDTECYPNFKLVASKEDDKGELKLL